MFRALAASRGRRARGGWIRFDHGRRSQGSLATKCGLHAPNPAMATNFGNLAEMKQAAQSCMVRLGKV
jgi:hypothetical protein